LTYNDINKTIYGFAHKTGEFGVDFTFTDDAGKKAYSNFNIKVLPVFKGEISLVLHYFLVVWLMVGFMIYMSYTWHFHLTLFTK
jgi:hypothetical protein